MLTQGLFIINRRCQTAVSRRYSMLVEAASALSPGNKLKHTSVRVIERMTKCMIDWLAYLFKDSCEIFALLIAKKIRGWARFKEQFIEIPASVIVN